ncbi:MAG: ATP-binding protein, partial [Planctomycetes bacterium]|nr:ATP-binding protein [Planctomycetota bacterium]
MVDHYSVGWRFQRATRIDHDSRDETALDGFVLHATGRQIVDRLFDRLVNSQQRAFTWTGPYGSGKSTLALFLCALLGGNIELRAAARKRFGKRQLDRLCSSLPEAGGNWLVLRVVGEKTDPHRAIASALRPALEEFFEGKVPRALKKELDPKSPRELLDILHRCAGKAAQRSGGLLLVIDEMGKFFDHAAEGKGDLHFFQELAEEFGRWDEVGLLVGILHQSFQVYAGRLDRGRRDEWSKIQGRFEDIPFTVTIEE